MPLPTALEAAIRREEFWRDYIAEREAKRWNFLVGYEWPSLGRRCRVEIPVGGGYQLFLDQGRTCAALTFASVGPVSRRSISWPSTALPPTQKYFAGRRLS
jgi:hypothetical protein